MINSSTIDYYYTRIIGNPKSLPILRPTPEQVGLGVIDGNQYLAGGVLGFPPTNLFFRQIGNVIIDSTAVPPSLQVRDIQWPTSQATSLQNIVFKMSDAPGTPHEGRPYLLKMMSDRNSPSVCYGRYFISACRPGAGRSTGSPGVLNDLVYYDGATGTVVGNQPYTMRNFSFFQFCHWH